MGGLEMKHNPLTLKKLRRFKSIKRGYYSFIIFITMIGISLCAELLINKRAILVCYEGKYYFPTYGNMIPGTVFGLEGARSPYRPLTALSASDHQNAPKRMANTLAELAPVLGSLGWT